jgi:hypothetical protein
MGTQSTRSSGIAESDLPGLRPADAVESIHYLLSIQAVDLYSIRGFCIVQARQLLTSEFCLGRLSNFSRPA